MAKTKEKEKKPLKQGILSDEEKIEALNKEPQISIAIKRYTGGDEFINNKKRWCLWLRPMCRTVRQWLSVQTLGWKMCLT